MVKAKFKCTSVTEHEGGNKEAKFYPVHDAKGENADFAKYTPGGNLSLMISPETKASNYFKPGQEYYLTITAASIRPAVEEIPEVMAEEIAD